MNRAMRKDKYHDPLNVEYIIVHPTQQDGSPYPNRAVRRKAAAEARIAKRKAKRNEARN